MTKHPQPLTSFALLVGKVPGSFELVIGDGVDHGGDVRIHALLRFRQFSGQIAGTRGSDFRVTLGRHPSLGCAADNSRDFGKREQDKPRPSFGSAFFGSLFKDQSHFLGESIPMIARIEQQKKFVGASHIASLARRRANPARVNCFMRSNSNCNCFTPAPVSRYACFWREVSSCSKRAIQPSSNNRRNAPNSVPSAHPHPAAAQRLNILEQGVTVAGIKLVRMSSTGSERGLDSIGSWTTCRMTTYEPRRRSFVNTLGACDKLSDMTRLRWVLSLALFAAPVFAALPVTPAPDQAALLKSRDPKLAANKKLCYDFFRVVLRARHLDEAGKYMRDDYIQHNPNADTGIAGFKAYFTKLGGPQPVQDTVPGLVAIQAEGNFVTLSFVREMPDPKNKDQKYTTTWFDMFRIQDGKIAEHWDVATK